MGHFRTYSDAMIRRAIATIFLAFATACTSSGGAAAGGVRDAGKGASTNDASVDDISIEEVHAGGFVFTVRVAGPKTGVPVILLHGFPETSYEWRHQMPALARAGYRAIAPDQRGYSPGARPPAVADYAVTLLAQDVVDIADAMGVDGFHLVGHDWGAAVAWVVAKVSAARVLTVSPISVPHPDAFRTVLSDHSSCQYTASSYFDLFVKPETTDGMLAADAGFLRNMYRTLSPEDAQVYLDVLDNRPAIDAALNWYRANIKDRQLVTGPLGNITVPTMFVWSDGDAALCRDGGDLTVNYVDAPYHFEIITGVDHNVPESAPDRLNELLLAEISGRDL